MKYKLNDVEISEDRMTELIDDLAMYPCEDSDIQLAMQDRKEKYLAELKANKALKISETLTIISQ